MRRLPVFVGVLSVALTLVTAPGSNARINATTLHLYTPFNSGEVSKGVRISKTVNGYCWTSSSSDQRPDAYRCFVGNYIHDPCFADTIGPSKFVLCPTSWPGSTVLRINLTKALPHSLGGSNVMRNNPWAIQLASGRWCLFLDGATAVIAGMRINYGCTGGTTLIGNPHRGSATWTIFAAKGFSSSSYSAVKIRAVWW